jgi:hypothetical protein
LWAASSRITVPVNNDQRIVLAGHINPRATAAADQGPAVSSFELPYVTLVLKPSAAQQTDLDHLLEAQQDPLRPSIINGSRRINTPTALV